MGVYRFEETTILVTALLLHAFAFCRSMCASPALPAKAGSKAQMLEQRLVACTPKAALGEIARFL
jgi:hypothetical protein